MRTMNGALIASAVLLATASSAFAQGMVPSIPTGLYIRGDVGVGFGDDVTFKSVNPGAAGLGTGSIPSETGTSFLFGGGIGYRFNPSIRTDFTLDYLPGLHLSGTSVGGASPGTKASGDLSSFVGLANGYIDLNGVMPHAFGPFQPYIDAGLGFVRNDLNTISGTIPGTGAYTRSGGAQINFAWGAGAGVAYPLTSNLTLDIAYKYLNLGHLRTGITQTSGGLTSGVAANQSDELTVHTVTLGLRYAFGAPPAPPPAPAPAVAAPPAPPPAATVPAKRVFIVFFRFDKASLTPEGRKVVGAAAAAFKQGKTSVAVAGYTDRAGTARYNMALSKRRADTVKRALIRDGVPASAIDESWHGEENPRVPTANGVREPQNRRVEITM